MSRSLSEAIVTLAPTFALVAIRGDSASFDVCRFDGPPAQSLVEAGSFLRGKKGPVRVYLTRQMAVPLLMGWEKPVFKLRQEEMRLSKAALEYSQITGNQHRPSAWDIREASAGFGLPWLYYGSPKPILQQVKALDRLVSIEPLSLAWLQAAIKSHNKKSSAWVKVQDLGGELSFLIRNRLCEDMVAYSDHPRLKTTDFQLIEARKAVLAPVWRSDEDISNDIDVLLGPVA